MVASCLPTAEELAALPEDQRGELIAGTLLPITPTEQPYGRVRGRIVRRMGNIAEPADLGEVDEERGFLLRADPDTVLAPRACFISSERNVLDGATPGFARVAPDIAVEIFSPSNTATGNEDRIQAHLDAGSRFVWVVDPDGRRVSVHAPGGLSRRLSPGEVLDGGDVFARFSVPLDELFG